MCPRRRRIETKPSAPRYLESILPPIRHSIRPGVLSLKAVFLGALAALVRVGQKPLDALGAFKL
jgi:hypothetical protein